MNEKYLSFNPGHVAFLQERVPQLSPDTENGLLDYDAALQVLKDLQNPQIVDEFFHAISQELNQANILNNLDLVEQLLKIGKKERALKVFSATQTIFKNKVRELPLYERALEELVGTSEHSTLLRERITTFKSRVEEGNRKMQEIEAALSEASA